MENQEGMSTYFMEVPHSRDDCAKAIQLLHIRGYIEKLHWACKDGNHTAVIIMEADSKERVLNMLPPIMRGNARVLKLNEYSPEQVEAMHLPALETEEVQQATLD